MSHRIRFLFSDHPPSYRVVWVTDLHLDAAKQEHVDRFLEKIREQNPDAILIGGDISNGVNFFGYLEKFIKLFHHPIYFVLGNHDFYFGSIKKTRQLTHRVFNGHKRVHYLTGRSDVVALTPNTALVGHDGWSDARAGSFLQSPIILNDYLLIDELKGLTTAQRENVLNRLGKEAADELRSPYLNALTRYKNVLVLTHTPPFREACLYEGKMCDEDWAPHFVCQALGEMLKDVLKDFPDREVLVLCGHSHHGADQKILPNLRVLTGHCDLGNPAIQGVIAIS